MMDFIIQERGNEVISERHQKNYNGKDQGEMMQSNNGNSFVDVDFDDI